MTVTLYSPTTEATGRCPDLLPWCLNHTVDDEGDTYHRTDDTDSAVHMTLCSDDPKPLSVHGEDLRTADGSVSPLVWVHTDMDTYGLRPDSALTFGLAIVTAARSLLNVEVTS